MEVIIIPVGDYQANCYLLTQGQDAVLIDPGSQGLGLVSEITDRKLTPLYILLTHGHFDHVGAVEHLTETYPNLPVYIHPEDINREDKAYFPLAHKKIPCQELKDGQEIPFLEKKFTVYETPGHTPGSVCLEIDGHVFTGDTLFTGSMGRTDFEGGDDDAIMRSLKRLSTLDPEWFVLPGHGNPSDIKTERRTNPFMKEAMETY